MYGIEMSAIADQAQAIVADNGFDNIITIIKGKVEDVDLPVHQASSPICMLLRLCALQCAGMHLCTCLRSCACTCSCMHQEKGLNWPQRGTHISFPKRTPGLNPFGCTPNPKP